MKRLTIDGNALRNRRHACGWTQEQLAHRAGLSIRGVAKAEAGKSISQSTVRLLAKALGGPDAVGETLESLVRSPRNIVLLLLESIVSKGAAVDQQLMSRDITIDIYTAETGLQRVSGSGEASRFLKRFAARKGRLQTDFLLPCRLLVEGNRAVTWGYLAYESDFQKQRRKWLIVANFEVADSRVRSVRIDLTPSARLRGTKLSEGACLIPQKLDLQAC